MFAEQLTDFFDVNDGHAINVTIAGATVAAIFSNTASDALMVAGAEPRLTVRSSDVSTTARGAAVVVNGTNYTVARIEHDGTGLARVLLEKA